jgi:hypothetical protein
MSKGATISEVQVPQYQESAYKDLFSAGRQAASLPFVPYTGPMVAGFSPDQLAGFDAARGLFGETQAFSPVSQLQDLAQTPFDVSSYMSPYIEGVIDPALRGIQERQDIAELQAQDKAIKAGAFGGSRGTLLETEAAKPYIQQAADTEAQLLQSGYEQALRTNAQQQAFQSGLLSDLFSQQLKGIGLLSGFGGEQQNLQQAAIDAARGEFMRALGYPAQQLNLLREAVTGVPAMQGTYQKQKMGTGDYLSKLFDLFV